MKSYIYALIILTLSACNYYYDKEQDITTDTDQQHAIIEYSDGSKILYRKTSYGNDWIYINLELNDSVAVSEEEHYNNTNWDIAFNRYNLRTNSGESGIGNGGALKTSETSFTNLYAIPSGYFTTDVVSTVTAPSNFMETIESTKNLVLCEAITFAGPPPTYTISPNIFIIRSADGNNYYKFQAISFFDQNGNSGFYRFYLEKIEK